MPISFNLDRAAAGNTVMPPINKAVKKHQLQPGPCGDSLETPAFNRVALPAPVWGTDRRIFPSDKGIVYGSFIQRLGFESGGFG